MIPIRAGKMPESFIDSIFFSFLIFIEKISYIVQLVDVWKKYVMFV